MKFSLYTSIGVAIIGVVLAFFVTNLIVPSLEPYSFSVIDKAQDSSASSSGYDYSSYVEPDNEIFNYKALNPTVEVYVGDCQAVDADGNCIDPDATDEEEEDQENQNGESDTGSEENGQENG